MKIALDAMGGDFGPPNIVSGAVLALKEYSYIGKLFLVGDTAQIEAELKNRLSSFKVPRAYVQITREEVPMLSSNKVSRRQIEALMAVKLSRST